MSQLTPLPSPASALPALVATAEKALPSGSPPNAETIAAMQEARQGSLPRFDSIDALMANLNADD